MNIMLERKLLSSVQELIYSFNRKKKPLYLLFKTSVNATYDCKLQIICLLLTMDVE